MISDSRYRVIQFPGARRVAELYAIARVTPSGMADQLPRNDSPLADGALRMMIGRCLVDGWKTTMPQNATALNGTTALNGAYIDAGGVRTFYLDKGEGPVIVLMHGSSIAIDARATWFRTIDALAERFRVIAFDQIGFGHTDMPPGGHYLGRLERARHAVDFLDALELDDVILVGHSEGGFMGSHMAITQPHRVARLVVITSGGTAPRLGGALDEPWMAASADAYGFTEAMENEDGFMASMDKFLYAPDEEFLGIIRSNYIHARTSGNLGLFRDRATAEPNPAPYTALQEAHIHPHLPSLDVPALLVWANNDATVPVERGLRLMELFGDGHMHVFDKAKHMVMIDQAAKFNSLLLGWCGA